MADKTVDQRIVYLTKNVFVAGRTPLVTYNPRDERQQESEVGSYLSQGGKALSVSGPTKSGKTVLIEKQLPTHDAIWLQGSDIKSVDEFWERIVDWYGLYDQVEVSTQNADQTSTGVSGSIGVPKVASVTANVGDSSTATSTVKLARKRAYAAVARQGLETLPVPIVLDDFHYIDRAAQLEVARAVKSIITITHVVLVAVPHEAFEVVRREPDMSGRVWNLRIEPWTKDELIFIAKKGFEALNVADPEDVVATKLAEHSYGAPFLMQQLCHDVCTASGILETKNDPQSISGPIGGWEAFFRRIANRITPPVFDRLLAGPKSRGQERIDRPFKDGFTTDIYGAVLRAIAMTGPKTILTYQEITRRLDAELKEDVPSAQQVSNTLRHMSTIAEAERGAGDPAVAYKDDRFYVLDPFLAFYLRWGDALKV
ncbi:ATP-binding protein [Prauserella flavalba]|uniref:ATP-binding protein n=1 Tax=Prauserella flavalba TaxID=1477506 RepID=UPI0011B39BCD|nr:ATP-binding protein [Prauserella flavalba]